MTLVEELGHQYSCAEIRRMRAWDKYQTLKRKYGWTTGVVIKAFEEYEIYARAMQEAWQAYQTAISQKGIIEHR